RNAAISACAVGSLAAIGALPPRPMIAPSLTTTAPTGTSPCACAWRASASASSIQCSGGTASPGFPGVTALLGLVRGAIIARSFPLDSVDNHRIGFDFHQQIRIDQPGH